MKKDKKPVILDKVRAIVFGWPKDFVEVAQVSTMISSTLGEVQHSFHFLNLEGVLSQAIKPSDFNPMPGDGVIEDKYKILRRTPRD